MQRGVHVVARRQSVIPLAAVLTGFVVNFRPLTLVQGIGITVVAYVAVDPIHISRQLLVARRITSITYPFWKFSKYGMPEESE